MKVLMRTLIKAVMQKQLLILTSMVLLLGSGLVLAKSVSLTNARIWNAPDHSRLVLELSGQVEHKVMMLSKPERLVLDIKDAANKARFDKLDLKNSPIKIIRSARRNTNDLRVVLDLKGKASPRSFLLKPNDKYGNRLVIDLYDQALAKKPKKSTTSLAVVGKKRDVVVMVDPGHGGEDPGAIGPGRVKEKTIVLAIAKELVSSINAKKGFKAKLTRSNDYYIGLRQRTEIARKHNADLLVSVHADAFKKAQANGASVFALSSRGATSETARWLAKKENAADLIGGVGSVSLGGKDNVLAGVLLDLSSTASLKASLGVGDYVLKSLGKVSRLHKRKVQQAGFVVLKAIEIPAVLVEVGFISNKKEERALKTALHHERIAGSIFRAIVRYCTEKSQCRVNQDSKGIYVVREAESLSLLAARFGTTISAIKRANKLKIDTLLIGQKLVIPEL